MITLEPIINEDLTVNQSVCKISDTHPHTADLMSIWEQFSYYSPGYKYTRQYIMGAWDGVIRLINLSKKQCPLGLIDKVIDYCQDANIQIENKIIRNEINVSTNTLESFINEQRYFIKDKEIKPRKDQIRASVRAIQMGRCINVAPTSFGKSLCIYIQCLFNISKNLKTLIIVPTIALVKQLERDFIEYSNNFIDEDALCSKMEIYTITGGKSKTVAHENIVISTWQSIYKLDDNWFNYFDWIICDEVHKANAQSLTSIFNKATKVKYRTGWTGSLQKSTVHELQVISLFGNSEKVVDTKTLMEQGTIAWLKIHVLEFQYSKEICENASYIDYQEEMKFLETYSKRNEKIAQLVSITKNTGMVVFRKISHGTELSGRIRRYCPNRNVYLIYGGHFYRNDVFYNNLEDLKEVIENDKDGILICGVQYFSTGISIRNINYIFFAAPFKSFVTTVQTIGRGLRISEKKKKLLLFDIADNMCLYTKAGKAKKQNYAFKHFLERFSIYNEERFEVGLSKMSIE